MNHRHTDCDGQGRFVPFNNSIVSHLDYCQMLLHDCSHVHVKLQGHNLLFTNQARINWRTRY